MTEQTLLKTLRGLTFTELSRLWRLANPGVDAAKVKKWKVRNRGKCREQKKRYRERQKAKQGWARRETQLPF